VDEDRIGERCKNINPGRSSGERRELAEEEEKGKRKETPLKSIFSEIDIGKGKTASELYYPIKKLELDKKVIFANPLEERGGDWLRDDYEKVWNNFVEEVDTYAYHSRPNVTRESRGVRVWIYSKISKTARRTTT
jgi:hypothetical protein